MRCILLRRLRKKAWTRANSNCGWLFSEEKDNTEEMRAKIEEALGILATENYGLSEVGGPGVSGECYLKCGLHFAEDHFLPEIIDPDTLEPLPMEKKGNWS